MRKERDSLGELEIPDDLYWGIHTERARRNFPVSSRRVPSVLIRALAAVKKSACISNAELGYLEAAKKDAICQACDEIMAGKMMEAFPLDALQGGAGTSTNMNINEVLANRALEILGKAKGSYDFLHPIEHVNMHQSTNDVYPTAVKAAAMWELHDVASAIAGLQGAFQTKEKEFADIVKIGRTELQRAVPMTMGAEFSAFAEAFARDRWRVFKCEERIRQINLGGTAVGTGLGAATNYIFIVTEKLREITGLSLAAAENRVDATANSDAFVEVSGILKAHACNLIKIAEDLRQMNMLGEIKLPPIQAGSSIMPGKVNPVMLEATIESGLAVIANDGLITECVSRATFQINEFLPLLAYALLESLEILKNVNQLLAGHVAGIEADKDVCRRHMETSPELITAFVPVIGYDRCSGLLHEFGQSGRENLFDFLCEKLGKETVERHLSPAALTQLGYRENAKDA